MMNNTFTGKEEWIHSAKKERLCPECDHPMDIHTFEPISVYKNQLMSYETKLPAYAIVCRVPDCPKTEGIQGTCFSSLPDELIESIEEEEE